MEIRQLIREMSLANRLWGAPRIASGIGAMDFLIVPTVGFRLLFVLVILRHERRRLISLSVTAHPTADQAVTRRLAAMGIRNHPLAPRSPC